MHLRISEYDTYLISLFQELNEIMYIKYLVPGTKQVLNKCQVFLWFRMELGRNHRLRGWRREPGSETHPHPPERVPPQGLSI